MAILGMQGFHLLGNSKIIWARPLTGPEFHGQQET